MKPYRWAAALIFPLCLSSMSFAQPVQQEQETAPTQKQLKHDEKANKEQAKSDKQQRKAMKAKEKADKAARKSREEAARAGTSPS